MKTLTTILAFFALAFTATAKIGETFEQVVNEARQDKDTVAIKAIDDIGGHPSFNVKYRNGDLIQHSFSPTTGREVAFVWFAAHQITVKEIGIVQRIFRTKWNPVNNSNPEAVGNENWVSQTGLWMMLEKGNTLYIFDWNDPRVRAASQGKTATTPTPAPTDDGLPNDCMIIATMAYNKLKPASYWARIGAFYVIKNHGSERVGHAVCFYQPTANGNVYMYERANGSLDLETKSHDMAVLIAQVNVFYHDGGIDRFLTEPRWVDGD